MVKNLSNRFATFLPLLNPGAAKVDQIKDRAWPDKSGQVCDLVVSRLATRRWPNEPGPEDFPHLRGPDARAAGGK
jgi:hypothetical protein